MAGKLEKVTALCLAFPEASAEPFGSHMTYRVRKKVFAYFVDNHHGDGIVSVCCKTNLGENLDLIREDPERFYMPAYIGHRGWVGIRVDRGTVDWDQLRDFIAASYVAVAPKKLGVEVRGR